MRAARFHVSKQLLAQALGLPASADIVSITTARDRDHYATVIVTDPALPEQPIGEYNHLIPTVTIKPDGRRSWNWNVPK